MGFAVSERMGRGLSLFKKTHCRLQKDGTPVLIVNRDALFQAQFDTGFELCHHPT